MTVHDLPKVDATLNAISTFLIILGWIMIRTEHKRAHALCMVSAIVASALFLGCCYYYHYYYYYYYYFYYFYYYYYYYYYYSYYYYY